MAVKIRVTCGQCGNDITSTRGHCDRCSVSVDSFWHTGYTPADVEALVRDHRQRQQAAAHLVSTLDAYDGSGIPQSDARDAFALLRRIQDNDALKPFEGMGTT